MATHGSKGMTFSRAEDAPSLDEDGMMSPGKIDPEVDEDLDLSPLADGSEVTVLFKGDGDNQFSLVHARFRPGFRLPRHSHSADCLDDVLSGEAIMGSRVMKPGDELCLGRRAARVRSRPDRGALEADRRRRGRQPRPLGRAIHGFVSS
jgi:hypothetical protein